LNAEQSRTDQQRPQIVFAWNYLQWGGSQIYTLSLIRHLRHDFRIGAVIPAESSPELFSYLREYDVAIETFTPPADLEPAPGLGRKISRRIAKSRSERSLVNAINRRFPTADVIHVDLAPQQSLSTLIRLLRRHAVVFTLHNRLPKVSKWREILWRAKLKMILRYPNFYIFTANADSKSYLIDFAGPEIADRVTITPAGIDAERSRAIASRVFDRKRALASVGAGEGKKVVLTVGQFIDRKGRWVLLEAAGHVLKERDDLQFIWLMPELPNAADIERIKTYGLDEHFKPVLSSDVGTDRDSILQFFRIADIFALPSLVEGLPIALLEAMSLGIPSISTRINAIPEAVVDGETGLLIEPGEPIALSQAILRLLTDVETSERIGRDGASLVLQKFDDRIAPERARAVYMSLANAFEPKGKNR
jgi:glycosyltransferase involved in cell wall biosynthesis